MPTLWPPFNISADEEDTETRIYMAGPRSYVQTATVAQGQPLVTTAESTLVAASDVQGGAWTLTSASAFLRPRGGFLITGAKGDNWFTYEDVSTNTLLGVRRLSGDDSSFPANTPVYQMRDITEQVKEFRWGFREAGSAYLWSATLTGEEWSSLIQFQDATIYVEQRYWNNIYGASQDEPVVNEAGDKLPGSGWTEWQPVFIGYLDPVRVTGDKDGAAWNVTARCESKYLMQQRVVPKTYGEETIPGTNTASSTLGNPAFEPTEGDGVNDFGPDRAANDNKRDLWISEGSPTLAAPLAERPSGFLSTSKVIPYSSGRGAKINTVFVSGIETNDLTQQQQMFFEIANINEEPDFDFMGDVETAGQIDITGYQLMNNYGQVVYLGSKNGYGLGSLMVQRASSIVVAYDKTIFDQLVRQPDEMDIFEFKQCDGFQQGVATSSPLDPRLRHRGIGSGFTLDRRGGWLALRTGGPRLAARYDSGCPQAEVVTDTCSEVTGRGTIVASNTTGFPSDGYLELGTPGTPIVCYYSGISGNTFTGVQKFTANNKKAAGSDVRMVVFGDWWVDFVAWGDPAQARPVGDLPRLAIPSTFWVATDDNNGDGYITSNQNAHGVEGRKVWGWRGNDGYTDSFAASSTTVQPAGIEVGQVLRRKNAMGGGVYEGNLGSGDFWNMDGGTAVDWNVLDTPTVGTAGADLTVEYLLRDLGEHTAAVVDSDDSDVGAADGTITVGAGQAEEYEAVMPAGLKGIRAGSTGVEFIYEDCDNDTFYGVVKTKGAGITIPPGTELVKLIDSNPRGYNRPRPPIPSNQRTVGAIELARFRDDPSAGVVEDRALIDGTIVCLPGSTRFFPDDGGFLTGPAVPNKGRYETLSNRWAFAYTSKENDIFLGVTSSGYVGGPMPAGSSVSLDATVSLPTRFQIRGSRRISPNDPLTYLSPGSNPDWEDIIADGRMTGSKAVYPIAGVPYYRHLVIIFKQMSDGGRAKLNTFRVYRSGKATADSGAATRLPPGQILSGTAAAIHNDILTTAGVPSHRRDLEVSLAIPAVPRLRVGQGTVWDAETALAKATGCFMTDGPLAKIGMRRKREMPGGGYQQTPPVRITTAAIIGQIEMESQPRHQAAQVRIEWENLARDDAGSVTYPAVPGPLGDLAPPERFMVANEQEAKNIAILRYLMMNGGERFKVTIGHMCTLKPEDLVRVEASIIDAAGRIPQIDCLVIGMDAVAGSDGQLVTYTLRDFRSR